MTPKEYIMQRYPIPRNAKKGMIVVTSAGKAGVITGWRDAYVSVRLVGEAKSRQFHPLDLAYGDEPASTISERLMEYNLRSHQFNQQLNGGRLEMETGVDYTPVRLRSDLTIIDEAVKINIDTFKKIAVRSWSRKDLDVIVYPTVDGRFAYTISSIDGSFQLSGNGYLTEEEANESARTYLEMHLKGE